jgi:hypothetical protein
MFQAYRYGTVPVHGIPLPCSGSDSDPAKTFEFFRIRIHNTAYQVLMLLRWLRPTSPSQAPSPLLTAELYFQIIKI